MINTFEETISEFRLFLILKLMQKTAHLLICVFQSGRLLPYLLVLLTRTEHSLNLPFNVLSRLI